MLRAVWFSFPTDELDSFQLKGEEHGKSMLPVESNTVELCSQEMLDEHFQLKFY